MLIVDFSDAFPCSSLGIAVLGVVKATKVADNDDGSFYNICEIVLLLQMAVLLIVAVGYLKKQKEADSSEEGNIVDACVTARPGGVHSWSVRNQ